jgi:hypothetical protein
MTYRLYFLRNGRIWAPPQHVECASDGEAIAHARALGDGQAIEVWERGRMVACVDPEFSRPAPLLAGEAFQITSRQSSLTAQMR